MGIVLFLYRKVILLRLLKLFIGFYQLFISYAWLLKASSMQLELHIDFVLLVGFEIQHIFHAV